jgi:hypothetical protein
VQTAGFVQEAWRKVVPESPYPGYFQDEIFG